MAKMRESQQHCIIWGTCRHHTQGSDGTRSQSIDMIGSALLQQHVNKGKFVPCEAAQPAAACTSVRNVTAESFWGAQQGPASPTIQARPGNFPAGPPGAAARRAKLYRGSGRTWGHAHEGLARPEAAQGRLAADAAPSWTHW